MFKSNESGSGGNMARPVAQGRPENNNAFIIASFGGLTFERGGAHCVFNQFIEAIPTLARRYNAIQDADLYVLGPDTDSTSPEYRADILLAASRVVTDEHLILMSVDGHQSQGFSDIYGDPHDIARRKRMCREAVDRILEIATSYKNVFVVGHEDHLVWVPYFLEELDQDLASRIAFVWVPHVLAAMYPNVYDDRFKGELEALSAFREWDRVAYVDNTVKDRLTGSYAIKVPLLKYRNEIWPKADRYSSISSGLLPTTPFIFAAGRLTPHKGIDEVLHLYDTNLAPLLPIMVLACPAQDTDLDYVRRVRSKIDQINGDEQDKVWLFDTYHPTLVGEALRSQQLQAVILPSRYELRSIYALEVRSFVSSNVGIFYRDLPTHIEVFKDSPNAIPFSSASSDSLVDVLSSFFEGENDCPHGVSSIDGIERYVDTQKEVLSYAEEWYGRMG